MALTTKPPRVIYLPEIAEPPTPGSGVVLYNATGGILSVKDENGVVQSVGSPSAVGEADYQVLTALSEVATWNDSTILVGVNGGATNRAHTLDLVQTGIDLTMAGGVAVLTLAEGGGGAGTVDIEDEGVPEGAADTIDFVGDGVSVTFASGKATVSIASGGGGGGTQFWRARAFTAPVYADYVEINHGAGDNSASTAGGQSMTTSAVANSSYGLKALEDDAPSTNFRITACLALSSGAGNAAAAVLYMRREGGTDDEKNIWIGIVTTDIGSSGVNGMKVQALKGTDMSTISGSTLVDHIISERQLWVRVRHDANEISNQIVLEYSQDGEEWHVGHQEARTAFFPNDPPNKFGFAASSSNNFRATCTVMSVQIESL